jgi:DNA polymerase-3 subunit delta'
MSEPIIGNDDIRGRLRELVLSDRLHPCLVFEGPVGLGKGLTATWLAEFANCEKSDPALRPCGGCWSCRQIPKDQHPDVIRVGVDPKKTAAIISVGQARELHKLLMVKPFHARRRFVIFDPADAMTTEAANALLKTFEDPPSQTHFILITGAPASLLLTVRSRSQRIRFSPVAEDELVAWLTQRGVAKPMAAARQAEGCPGRALALDLGGVDEWRSNRDEFLNAMNADVSERFKYTERMVRGDRSKWVPKLDLTLDAVSSMLRDALSVSHGGTIYYNPDRAATIQDWADALGPAGVAATSVTLSEGRERLDRYVNGRLVLDTIITQLGARLDAGRAHATV